MGKIQGTCTNSTCVSHGAITGQLGVNSGTLYNTRHPGQTTLDWHEHDHSCLTYHYAGAYREEYNRRSFELDRPSVLFKPRGERHFNEYSNRGAKSIIITPPADSDRFKFDSAPFVSDASEIILLASCILLEIHNVDDFSPLVIDGATSSMLGLVFRSATIKEQAPALWLRRVRSRIVDEFRGNLTMKTLSEEAGVHPDHLSRMFKHHYGMLPGHYQRYLRLCWARDQLSNTKKPIAVIATEAGFSDQSHFTRLFHRQFSCTPAVWRRNAD